MIEAAVMEVAVAVGTEIAGELGARCAVEAALEVGKAAGALSAGKTSGLFLFAFMQSFRLKKSTFTFVTFWIDH
jgi:hypothetical protein